MAMEWLTKGPTGCHTRLNLKERMKQGMNRIKLKRSMLTAQSPGPASATGRRRTTATAHQDKSHSTMGTIDARVGSEQRRCPELPSRPGRAVDILPAMHDQDSNRSPEGNVLRFALHRQGQNSQVSTRCHALPQFTAGTAKQCRTWLSPNRIERTAFHRQAEGFPPGPQRPGFYPRSPMNSWLTPRMGASRDPSPAPEPPDSDSRVSP
jgi:hypothetical protein